ncbi:hypothetical protein EYF80_032397 [Liparis tanakae]|uniref:Uncharacterized protein n=1 Tax=Liparis tanakae TaxID=230148 RepID=A0A4Z2GVF0_9TELE|nr:hypothetical protein EYF80_032397 [Liparis tanakae]
MERRSRGVRWLQGEDVVDDVQKVIVKEEQDWSSSLDQEDPEPPHIKEDQEDLWTNQEGEQLDGLEEAGIRFSFSPVKSEDDEEEEEAQSSHLHQRLTKLMETEADEEDYRGPEPDRKSGPEPDRNLSPDRHFQLSVSDNERVTDDDDDDDEDDDWRETTEPPNVTSEEGSSLGTLTGSSGPSSSDQASTRGSEEEVGMIPEGGRAHIALREHSGSSRELL